MAVRFEIVLQCSTSPLSTAEQHVSSQDCELTASSSKLREAKQPKSNSFG